MNLSSHMIQVIPESLLLDIIQELLNKYKKYPNQETKLELVQLFAIFMHKTIGEDIGFKTVEEELESTQKAKEFLDQLKNRTKLNN